MREHKIVILLLLSLLSATLLFSEQPTSKYSYFRNYGDNEFQYKRFDKGLKFAVIPAENFVEKKDDLLTSLFGNNSNKIVEIDYDLKRFLPSIFKDFNFIFFDKNHSIFDADSVNINAIREIAKENTMASKIDAHIKEPRLSYRKMKANPAMLENIKYFQSNYNCDYLMLHLTSTEMIKAHIINRNGDNIVEIKMPVIETQIWNCKTGKMLYSGKTFCSKRGLNSTGAYIEQMVKESVEFMKKMLKVKRPKKKATGMFG